VTEHYTYQGRVIWLLPLWVMLIGFRHFRQRRPDAAPATPLDA